MSQTRTNVPTCRWRGASGIAYRFYVYPLPASFNPGQPGNYIFARLDSQNRWIPIYVGEGDLRERGGPGHHKATCIRQHEATHFHCHLNTDTRARLSEEADLLASYGQAYEPSGCNSRP